ncbi:MAG: type 4a pilus biogenesis protein PilO [candidate division Zixibacteria bacterium]|nr:type 4a pilus biogenesis protein PilO [candidate division Zixibacteria bacterium]
MSRRMGIYAVGAVVIIGLWFLLLYAPLVKKHEQVRADTMAAEAQLADFAKTMEELPEFLATSQNLDAFKRELNAALFTRRDILALISRISRDAVDNGLTVTEITPPVMELLQLSEAPVESGEPRFLNITVSVTGHYTQFGKYVSQIEATPYFRGINTCRIDGTRERSTKLTASVGFKALIGNVQEAPA